MGPGGVGHGIPGPKAFPVGPGGVGQGIPGPNATSLPVGPGGVGQGIPGPKATSLPVGPGGVGQGIPGPKATSLPVGPGGVGQGIPGPNATSLPVGPGGVGQGIPGPANAACAANATAAEINAQRTTSATERMSRSPERQDSLRREYLIRGISNATKVTNFVHLWLRYLSSPAPSCATFDQDQRRFRRFDILTLQPGPRKRDPDPAVG